MLLLSEIGLVRAIVLFHTVYAVGVALQLGLRAKSTLDRLRSILGQTNFATAYEPIVAQRWPSSHEAQLSSSRTQNQSLLYLIYYIIGDPSGGTFFNSLY